MFKDLVFYFFTKLFFKLSIDVPYFFSIIISPNSRMAEYTIKRFAGIAKIKGLKITKQTNTAIYMEDGSEYIAGSFASPSFYRGYQTEAIFVDNAFMLTANKKDEIRATEVVYMI